MRYRVEKRGEFLALVYRDRYTESATILVPEEVKDDYARFYTLIGGAKIYAEFFIERDRVTLLFERYRLVKRGRAS